MADRPASIRTDLIYRQLQDCLKAGRLVRRGSDGLQQLQQGSALGHLLDESGIESLECIFLSAEGEVLFLQQALVCLQYLLQMEFVDRIGDDPVQGVSREVILHHIVLYPTVHGLHGQLLGSLSQSV